uniref:DDE Tnp4 domain-containing protein n=1 Tax=Capitella teleta TaxID=283909 RepID=X1Z3P6_CAPTE
MQATTWSDYKKENTLKYLVAITPTGLVSFISEAWGGRATDRHITQQSGFLNLIEANDTVMAGRGFPIQENLLYRFAKLEIPPPSSGLEQMSAQNVMKTKRVANVRIPVERAINRLKWFNIMDSTLQLNMLSLFDDILVICAALCNLHHPLMS